MTDLHSPHKIDPCRFTSSILDALSALVVVLDAQGRIVRFNQACEALSGYTFDQVKGQHFWDLLLVPEEIAPVQAIFEQLRAGQFPNKHTNYWLTKDGRRRQIAWSNTAILNQEGAVEYVVGTGVDVTKQVETEKALRESEARYRLLFNSGTDAVFVHQLTPESMPGQFIEVNDIACQRLGYTRKELLQLTPLDIDAPGKRERGPAIMEKLCTDNYVLFEAVHVARDGTHIPVEINAHLFELNGRPTVLSIARDISERKQTQQALRESEQTARALLNASTDLTLLLDAAGTILAINQAAAHRFEDSPERLIGTRVYEHIAPGLAQSGRVQIEQVISSGTPARFQSRWRDTVFDISASPVFDTQGQVKRLAIFAQDITDEVKAEKEIKQRNQELIVLNEISRAITSTLDLQETLTLITDNTNQLLGVEATAVILHDKGQGDLWFAAASGAGSGFVREMRLALDQGIAGWVTRHGEAAIVPDTTKDARFFDGFDQSSGFVTRSMLCVPLHSKGQTIGAIEAMNKESGTFDQEDIRLLSALAASAAIAIENAQLFEQVRSGREQLQALSRRLVEVQEAERRHISRELHDETGQALSSMLLGLSLLEREADDPEAIVARAIELEEMVDLMLENLHRMAMNLRPASLDHLGLVAALDQYCETFGQQYGLDVQFETVGLEMGKRLLPEVETALYRIVQEALTNVIRHAQARHVDVLLERRGDHVVTIVEDDGVGFDMQKVAQRGRLGVFGMHERAEMLGGDMMVESAPGAGTSVFVEVPYADQDPHR